MFYIIVAVKLILGLLALVLVINLTGKGNLAPASASDQVQNYVLGGIVGGVIYNTDISIPVFMLILAIWFAAVLSLRWLKKIIIEAIRSRDCKNWRSAYLLRDRKSVV